jgi:predicted ATPase
MATTSRVPSPRWRFPRPSLHGALLARLDRLAAAKLVAQLGAAIGRTFAYDLVQAVAPLNEATLQPIFPRACVTY